MGYGYNKNPVTKYGSRRLNASPNNYKGNVCEAQERIA